MSVGSTPTRATRVRTASTSRGPMATTPLLQRGNGGSTPSGTTRLDSLSERRWSASALAACLSCKEGDRVRFSGGPLSVIDDRWAAGPTERHLACNQEIGVRLPGGPLGVMVRCERWKVAGYGWPGRTANAVSLRGMRVRIPCLPLFRPDGEEDDHASVLTRSPGFESWSGHRGDSRGPRW